MKNRLSDLNDMLFAQLERLTDEDLPREQIDQEVARTQSVVQLADRNVSTARVQLDGVKFAIEHGANLPPSLALPASATPKP